MKRRLTGIGPLKLNGLEIGYYTPDKYVLEYENDSSKNKYLNRKEYYSENLVEAEEYIKKKNDSFLNIYFKNFSIEYKSARKALQDEVVKNIDITETYFK